MKIKKIGVIGIVSVSVFLVGIFFHNFIIFSGYYHCKDTGDKAKNLFEKSYNLRVPQNAKLSNFTLYKTLIINQGYIFSKLEVPTDKVNEIILNIPYTYKKVYTEKRNDLKDFAMVDRNKEPNLMGELYDPELVYEKIISTWIDTDNIYIDYMIKTNAGYLLIYVSEDINGTTIIYLQTIITSLKDVQESFIFRKWF